MLTLQIKSKMLGFQDQEAWTLVENEEHSVRFWYVSYNVFVEKCLGSIASVQDSTSNTLQRYPSSSKSCFLLTLQIKSKMLGFQDQEAWTLVENEEHSVGTYYVSYNVFVENMPRKHS